MAYNDPGVGMMGRIYIELHMALLHTKYTSFGFCGFREEDVFIYFHISLWKIMTPQGRGLYGPQGNVGRIYKEEYCTLLYTKNERFQRRFFMFVPL